MNANSINRSGLVAHLTLLAFNPFQAKSVRRRKDQTPSNSGGQLLLRMGLMPLLIMVSDNLLALRAQVGKQHLEFLFGRAFRPVPNIEFLPDFASDWICDTNGEFNHIIWWLVVDWVCCTLRFYTRRPCPAMSILGAVMAGRTFNRPTIGVPGLQEFSTHRRPVCPASSR